MIHRGEVCVHRNAVVVFHCLSCDLLVRAPLSLSLSLRLSSAELGLKRSTFLKVDTREFRSTCRGQPH